MTPSDFVYNFLEKGVETYFPRSGIRFFSAIKIRMASICCPKGSHPLNKIRDLNGKDSQLSIHVFYNSYNLSGLS